MGFAKDRLSGLERGTQAGGCRFGPRPGHGHDESPHPTGTNHGGSHRTCTPSSKCAACVTSFSQGLNRSGQRVVEKQKSEGPSLVTPPQGQKGGYCPLTSGTERGASRSPPTSMTSGPTPVSEPLEQLGLSTSLQRALAHLTLTTCQRCDIRPQCHRGRTETEGS